MDLVIAYHGLHFVQSQNKCLGGVSRFQVGSDKKTVHVSRVPQHVGTIYGEQQLENRAGRTKLQWCNS